MITKSSLVLLFAPAFGQIVEFDMVYSTYYTAPRSKYRGNQGGFALADGSTDDNVCAYGRTHHGGTVKACENQLSWRAGYRDWIWLQDLSIDYPIYIQIEGGDALWSDTIHVSSWDRSKSGLSGFKSRTYGQHNKDGWCISQDSNDWEGYWERYVPDKECYSTLRLDPDGYVWAVGDSDPHHMMNDPANNAKYALEMVKNFFKGRRLAKDLSYDDFTSIPETDWVKMSQATVPKSRDAKKNPTDLILSRLSALQSATSGAAGVCSIFTEEESCGQGMWCQVWEEGSTRGKCMACPENCLSPQRPEFLSAICLMQCEDGQATSTSGDIEQQSIPETSDEA